jgi:ribosomal protein S18 acetylase RimI-like enzyme
VGDRERAQRHAVSPKRKEHLLVEISIAGPEDANDIRELQYESWLENNASEESGRSEGGAKRMHAASSCDETLSKEDGSKLVQGSRKNSLPESETFVAKINRKVIGFCTVVRGSEQNSLTEIYIIPAFQGKKIGRRLWDSARQFIDRNKDTTVALLRFNVPAKKFYEGLGFAETGVSWEDENVKNRNGAAVIEMILRA